MFFLGFASLRNSRGCGFCRTWGFGADSSSVGYFWLSLLLPCLVSLFGSATSVVLSCEPRLCHFWGFCIKSLLECGGRSVFVFLQGPGARSGQIRFDEPVGSRYLWRSRSSEWRSRFLNRGRGYWWSKFGRSFMDLVVQPGIFQREQPEG
ncbi:hypothetical protein C2G38_2151422 [Gigaspora rosea]|uniref:Uncharacterized protein n=1 Tax=Gigaspora rosea TaxID=44941 RepID=A0A397WE71_9GLOM|nr:hypothetical protein C2G38_2151422 [Gigaspora rosea]